MRFFLSIAILLCAAVTLTVSASTRSTIQGPTQGSFSTSTLSEDCLSTVDWRDVVFLAAVPIAIGFGLLLLLASVQDLRQARKSSRSRPSAPSTIRGNKARKERTYVIDVDYAGRSRWGSFLRRCVMRKSSGAYKNPRLVRLQGTIGFSDWMSFDLVLGKNSEQKTITTPRSIGKLVAVETKYPSASREINSMHLPTSNIGACLRGVLNRACDIEIKTIRATDAKTQETFISGRGPSSAGISISEQGIITILPLLPFTAKPTSRVSYLAYFFKTGSMWTSAFIPWREGNFTGARHITCLFMCITYTMCATQVMSNIRLQPSKEEVILVSFTDLNVTAALVIRAVVSAAVVFSLVNVVEIVFRVAPTVWSSHLPCVPLRARNGNPFTTAANGCQPTHVQSTAGDFYGGRAESVEEGLPRMSSSAPEMKYQGSTADKDANDQQTSDAVSEDGYQWTVINSPSTYSLTTEIMSLSKMFTRSKLDSSDKSTLAKDTPVDKIHDEKCYSTSDAEPSVRSSFESAKTSSEDICGDNQSICPADMLECHHRFACYKCPVCKRTTGSRYYSPGAGCSGVPPPIRYNMYGSTELTTLRYAYSSSTLDSEDTDSLNSITTAVNLSKSLSSVSSSDSLSSSDYSRSTSISDSSSDISGQLLDESAPYSIQDATKTTAIIDNDNQDLVEKDQTAPSMPSAEGPSQHGPYSISRATSTSGLLYNQQKNISKREAGDRQPATKYRDEQYLMEQEDHINAMVGFKLYSAAVNNANIKSAKTMRTKNYINKFSDMGKGRVAVLPHLDTENFDAFLPKNKPNDKQLTDNKSSQSAPGGMPELTKDHIKTPTECDPVTTSSDYVIDMAMTFEMPNVTIQSSSSHKSFFFNLRKWLGGLRSKPKPDIGDDYKLEVTENDVAIKTSDKNAHLSSINEDAVDTSTIQTEEDSAAKSKPNSLSSFSTSGCADKNLKNISHAEDDEAQMSNAGDHLQGSIFQSSSRLIEYQPQVTKVASSDSWGSISSADRRLNPCTDANATNKNNNSNEAAVVETEPSSSPMPCSTSSDDEYKSTDSSMISSMQRSPSSLDTPTVDPKSSSSKNTSSSNDIFSSNGISSDKDICKSQDIHSSSSSSSSSSNITAVTSKEDSHLHRYKYFQALYEAERDVAAAATESQNELFQSILFLTLHVVVILSCLLALVWSVSSIHGLCWAALWQWVATSIIAVLIHAVILDTLKAAFMTFVKWYYYYEEAKPKPYSVIY